LLSEPCANEQQQLIDRILSAIIARARVASIFSLLISSGQKKTLQLTYHLFLTTKLVPSR